MDSYSVAAWFELLAFGAFVGAGGQGTRMIVGLKKLSDAASAASETRSAADLIIPSQLLVSLAIGAIAGGIAAVSTIIPASDLKISGEEVAGLAAAGYAGADFIEGFMSRARPSPGQGAGDETVATGTASPAAASNDGAVG